MLKQSCQNQVLDFNLNSLVQGCLAIEKSRGLAKNSIKSLKTYLDEFVNYCNANDVSCPGDLSPDFLKRYTEHRCHASGPTLKKSVVWTLRKFGKFLHIIQIVDVDPAKKLCHPKFHIRSELPDYLSVSELRRLLEYAAKNMGKQGFAIISLLAATGLRPKEVTSIRLKDTHLHKFYVKAWVKGGWNKKTALSIPVAKILNDYLNTRDDCVDVLFINKRKRPVSVSWLQSFVKKTGQAANLTKPLTCNCLRHTFATHAADRHGKIITKALMGHQHLSFTEIYTHLSPRRFKRVAGCHPQKNLKRSTS